MAFTLNLPTITDLLSSLFPMRIYETNNLDNVLPCSIMEIIENQSYNIPNEPLDDNTIINDTIYTLPKVLNLRVFVNTNNLIEFESSIKNLQFNSGFTIIGKDDQIYDNYRLESITTSQTASVEGGYFYDMAFKEIKVIQSFSQGLPIQQVANPAYSTKEQVGEVANTETNKTILKKGWDSEAGVSIRNMLGGFFK